MSDRILFTLPGGEILSVDGHAGVTDLFHKLAAALEAGEAVDIEVRSTRELHERRKYKCGVKLNGSR